MRAIRDHTLAIVQAGRGSWKLRGSGSESPAPYESWLRRFVVAIGTGPVCVTVTEDAELRVTGDPGSLGVFASFFDAPKDSDVGWRSHHEHYPGIFGWRGTPNRW